MIVIGIDPHMKTHTAVAEGATKHVIDRMLEDGWRGMLG